MRFWDRFVLRVFATFSGGYAPGLQAAAAVLEYAHQRGRLNVAELSDLSVFLCLLTWPPGAPLHGAVGREYDGRRRQRPHDFDDEHVGEALLTTCPRRMSDLLGIGAAPHLSRALCFTAVRRRYLWSLCEFLARLHRATSSVVEPAALVVLYRAFKAFNVGHLANARGDFACYLYRYLLARIPRGSPPGPSSTGWLGGVSPEEVRFLNACQRLNNPDRILIYLSFYAELNTEQISYVLQTASPAWTPPYVEKVLRRAWELLLQ